MREEQNSRQGGQKKQYDLLVWEDENTCQKIQENGAASDGEEEGNEESGFFGQMWGYQEQEEEELRIKDFFDFAKDSFHELEKLEKPEKSFRQYFDIIWNQDNKILTMKLASHMQAFSRWYTEKKWTVSDSVEEHMQKWNKQLAQWRQEDSFPTLYKGLSDWTCDKRDLVIYILMVSEVSVADSDYFLEEMSRMKDNAFTRPLYALHFKEGFFRWIMLWNENHPDMKIGYEEACHFYQDYAKNLVKKMAEKTFELDERVRKVLTGSEQVLVRLQKGKNPLFREKMKDTQSMFLDFRSNYLGLWQLLLCETDRKEVLDEMNKTCKTECIQGGEEKKAKAVLAILKENWQDVDLFDSVKAEDLQRLIAVLAHIESSIKECRWIEKLADTEQESEKGAFIQAAIHDWEKGPVNGMAQKNSMTRAEDRRGTQFAGRKMSDLAAKSRKDFYQAFEEYQRVSEQFIRESYWHMFSELMYLYSRSGGEAEKYENDGLAYRLNERKSAENKRKYKDASIFDEKGSKILSFTYAGKEVSKLIDSETANGTLISNMLNPVTRRDEDVFSNVTQKSSPAFSLLKNNYQDWCKGRKGPYQFYKRENVLKMALAAGMEEISEINEVMYLAGCRELNYLDRKEALVYLAVVYKQKLGEICRELLDILNEEKDSRNWKREQRRRLLIRLWKRMYSVCRRVPKEWFVRNEVQPDIWEKDLSLCSDEELEEIFDEGYQCAIDVRDDLKIWLEHSLVFDIRQMERLFLQFYTWELLEKWQVKGETHYSLSENEIEEMKKFFFYGPYVADFEGSTIANLSACGDGAQPKEKQRSGKEREYEWIRMQIAMEALMRSEELLYAHLAAAEKDGFTGDERAQAADTAAKLMFQYWREEKDAGNSYADLLEFRDSGEADESVGMYVAQIMDGLQQIFRECEEEGGLFAAAARAKADARGGKEEGARKACDAVSAAKKVVERAAQALCEAVENATFLLQSSNAMETREVLQKYFQTLAVVRMMNGNSDMLSQELKHRVFHWYVVGGAAGFSLKRYMDVLPYCVTGTMDERALTYWTHRRGFWKTVYQDIGIIRASTEWCIEHCKERDVYRKIQKEFLEKIEVGSPVERALAEEIELEEGILQDRRAADRLKHETFLRELREWYGEIYGGVSYEERRKKVFTSRVSD